MDHPVASQTIIPDRFTFQENSLHVFNNPMWHTARDHSTWMINIALSFELSRPFQMAPNKPLTRASPKNQNAVLLHSSNVFNI